MSLQTRPLNKIADKLYFVSLRIHVLINKQLKFNNINKSRVGYGF
jgi:hypothetical protein